MTITVSVEELQSYRDAMEAWTRKRGAHIATWAQQNVERDMHGLMGTMSRDRFDTMLTDYDAKNPLPKILPAL